MNIRPWHDETTLPIPLLTGADRAREFANTEAAVHELPAPAERACSACRGDCHAPQACQQPELCAAFPLQPLFCRHPWLGPVMVACVVIVWLCVDAYLEMTQ
jgi:hypothetical protein